MELVSAYIEERKYLLCGKVVQIGKRVRVITVSGYEYEGVVLDFSDGRFAILHNGSMTTMPISMIVDVIVYGRLLY